MSAPLLRSGRQFWAAVRALLVATVALGLVYPLVVTGLAQVIAPGRADGSLLPADGRVVGSSLIGQGFVDAAGNPLPQYFQSRPSASNYDGTASGGSNLGPDSLNVRVPTTVGTPVRVRDRLTEAGPLGAYVADGSHSRELLQDSEL